MLYETEAEYNTAITATQSAIARQIAIGNQHSNDSGGSSRSTTDEIQTNSNELGNISTDLNLISIQHGEITENFKPSFWNSSLGQGLKWTGIVVGSFALGYVTNEIVDAISAHLGG